VDIIIYIGRIGRYLKEKHFGEPGIWKFGICDSRRIFDRSEK